MIHLFNEEESDGGKKLAGWASQNPANPRRHCGRCGDRPGYTDRDLTREEERGGQ